MSNFYNDNPDLKHHLSHPLMRKIVEMKERNFSDAEKFDLCHHLIPAEGSVSICE